MGQFNISQSVLILGGADTLAANPQFNSIGVGQPASGVAGTAMINTITAAASTDLTLNAGSGANNGVTAASTGSGTFTIQNVSNNPSLTLSRTTTSAGTAKFTLAASGLGLTLALTHASGTQNVTGYNITADAAIVNTSGASTILSITPTYNQVTSTAANTDFLVNRTQTSVGSGAQLLMDLQVASTSKFSVSNTGATVVGASLNVATTLTMGSSINWSGPNGDLLNISDGVTRFRSNSGNGFVLDAITTTGTMRVANVSNGALGNVLANNVQATFTSSDGTAGLTQVSTSTTAKSITLKNGLVVAFA